MAIIKSLDKTGISSGPQKTVALPIALTTLLAIIAGLAAASGSLLIAGLIGAALCCVFLFFAPIPLLWFVIVGATTVAGLTTLYLPQAGPVRWSFVLAALFLGLSAIARHFFDKIGSLKRNQVAGGTLLFWCLLYLAIVIFSSLYNDGLDFGVVVGLKNHFQVWGILVAFMLIPMTLRQANAFIYYLLFLGTVQLIPVLHQYFVLVPQRAGLTKVDVVVGTFVGSMHGGGANALLAMVQVTCVALLAGFWRLGKLRIVSLVLASLLLLIPTLLNEAKIVLVALPLALGVVFWDYLKRHVVVLMLSSVMIVPVLAGLLWIQADIMREHNMGKNRDLQSFIESTIEYNVGEQGYGNYILNRTSVYTFWWSQHGSRDALGTLIGHGAASSKDADASLSENTLAQTRYPGYGIGLTGVSALLWETGILGLIAVVGLLASALRLANRLANHYGNSQIGMNIRAAQAGVAVFAASLLHNQSFVFELGYQTVLMLLLGYIAVVGRLTFGEHGIRPANIGVAVSNANSCKQVISFTEPARR